MQAQIKHRTKQIGIKVVKLVDEEADETIYWLEILDECSLIMKEKISDLIKETHEILSIIVASINTTRKNLKS